jgi:pyruvate formate lyase activating enzyme
MTVEEVMAEVEKNMPFIRGITVSGGECTLQAEFLKELFLAAKEKGLTTLADSNGSYCFSEDKELLAVMDGAMIDIKAFFSEDHLRITGQDNKKVLEQSLFLAEKGKLFEIRTVIAPELFDTKETVSKICELFKDYNEKRRIRYKLIAFRPIGVRKAYAKGLTMPDEALMQELKTVAKSYGFTDIITT